MEKLDIGLTVKQRETVINLLQTLLADEVALYFAARGAHWNVVGVHFGPLHAFFQEQYEAVDEIMDEVAERIRMLGGKSSSTLDAYVKAKRVDDKAGQTKSAEEMLKSLLGVHEHVIRELRKDVDAASDNKDEGTADFLTGLMEQHEKMAWMVRAHLE
ncbi:MAG: DNA starvation/stationary phase protection protein [Burkholderiaceae bacterium]